MTSSPPAADSPTPSGEALQTGSMRDVLPLLILAAGLALVCRGHFIKPHGDFYEFRETGRALLRGAAPPTFKRAPVYPLLVTATGTLLGAAVSSQTPADQLAAGWINVLSLPCSVLLCYSIGRRWFGHYARWAALWFALLPIGLHCAAHTLVEPLLVTMVLATVRLAQSGSGWAYVAAAVATMTRYDAAGLIAGVAIADWVRRRRPGSTVARTLAAAAPLVLWLALTALTWESSSHDHYLRQLAERRDFDFLWPLAMTLRSVFDPESLAAPVWVGQGGAWLGGAALTALAATALIGVGALLVRRDPAAVVATMFFGCYALVHGVFPFREGFARFAYPLAPFVILATGAGLHYVAKNAAGVLPGRGVRRMLLAAAGLLLAILILGEVERLHALFATARRSLALLPAFALGGTALAWGIARRDWRRPAGTILTGAALLLLATVQTRAALPLLGGGHERINDVIAARWIRDHTTPSDGVLTDSPGLLRLYCADRPADRFVGLGQIAAEDWPDILAECRRRGVTHVIWHDQVFSEQGAYYIEKWRLERYALLAEPETVAGVKIVLRLEDRPTLWILRLTPE